jgi:hypothetical protein
MWVASTLFLACLAIVAIVIIWPPTMPARLRVRQALALPIYVLSLLLVFGCLAAGMAGDDWPE